MESHHKVLLLGVVSTLKNAWSAVVTEDQMIQLADGSRENFLKDCQSGIYDGIAVIGRSAASTDTFGRVDSEFLDNIPESVRFIVHAQAGYDSIDILECTKRGIAVSHCPGTHDEAVADTTMFLILGAIRRFWAPMVSTKAGQWRSGFSIGHGLLGKTLGILGMGGIGGAVAKRAAGFGMKVQYYNRRPLQNSRLPEGVDISYVTFEELLKTSDVLSLCLPLSNETRHIIGAKEFSMMKDGVVIVNTARGPVMDEQALVDALDSDKVFGVGLDVFEGEPTIHPALMKNDRAFLTPHIAWGTFESKRGTEMLILNNIKSALHTGKLLTQVPEQKET